MEGTLKLKRGAGGKRHYIKFPDVRVEIEIAIKLYSAGKWRIQKMMTFVAGRLDEYGLDRIDTSNYSVRVMEPIETILGTWPVVIIEVREVTSDPGCPLCRSEADGYLINVDDLRSGCGPFRLMCRECGTIYRYVEVN